MNAPDHVPVSDRPVVDALVLAAGGSSRMAPYNKLLATGADGRALIAITVAALRTSAVRSICVVLGHQHDAVAQAIGDPAIRTVICPDFAAGLSRSLRTGLHALPPDGAAVLVCLGDMPLVGPPIIDALIAAWSPGAIVVPMHGGQRGNPVLWDRSFDLALCHCKGDQGGSWLLQRHPEEMRAVSFDDDAVLRDADTPAALRGLPGGPWHAPDGTLI